MTDISIKRVSKDKFQNTVEDNISMGYTLKTKSDNIAVLEKPGNWGTFGAHLIVFLLTVWWTHLIGNILYALYCHYGRQQELQIKTEE